MLRRTTRIALFVCVLAPIGVAYGGDAVLFPDALDAAAVIVDTLDDVKKKALVLGNGDLNALLFSQGKSLKLRISKNDVWDARIDTSEDPPPARFNVEDHSWKGGASRVPSWHGRPYPHGSDTDRPPRRYLARRLDLIPEAH